MSSDRPVVSEETHAPAPGEEFEYPGSPDRVPVVDVDSEALLHRVERADHPLEYSELLAHPAELKRSIPPMLQPPGFGEPDEICGEHIHQALHYCTECRDVKPRRHVCNRYDCPQHAPVAVRRRVKGTPDASGLLPQLDALARYLGSATGDRYVPWHIIIKPPSDWAHESDDRWRLKTVGTELLEDWGLQGALFYHPWSGEHEDPEEDDLGEWPKRLPPFHGEPREWQNDVRDELEFAPHLHAFVMAPDYLPYDWTEELEAATGWVVNCMPVSKSDDDEDRLRAAARTLTYCGSHAGVYGVGDQRRLAAWTVGPDINQITPTSERRTAWIGELVNDAAEETLGISAADNTCYNDVVPEETVEDPGHLHVRGRDDDPASVATGAVSRHVDAIVAATGLVSNEAVVMWPQE